MARDVTKAKPDPAPKSEAPAAEKTKPDAAATKAEASEKPAAAPASYSRGEGQKPVTQAYKDNWNAIFGKMSPNKSKKKR